MSPALTTMAEAVPHYDGTAAVTGSLVFLVLLGIVTVAALRKRRR